MQKETYERIFAKIQSGEKGVFWLRMMGTVLTYAAAFCYIAAVVVSICYLGRRTAAVLILVPAVSFLAVSVFRSCFNAKRPYEIYDFKPLLEKDTKGKSFPSRHVFSIFVIGSTLFQINPAVGIPVCLMGCVLAVIRVIAGVHFPRDVAAGGIIGVVCGCVAGLFL